MTKQIINIGVPTLHCYDKLVRLCETLANDAHEKLVPRFTIVDNGGSLAESNWLARLQQLPITIEILVPPSNLGVAASWNLLIKKLGRCFISNDDVVFSLSDLSKFLDAALESPETILFDVAGPRGGCSVFLMNRPELWMEMGGFDENFYPAYFEDNDAYRRMELANLPRQTVALQDWAHETSSTLANGSEEYRQKHWENFARNASYYQQKWGGPPNQEVFTKPFGGIS